MKSTKTYQYIGGEMTSRDKQEIDSKFWNEGKWNNFVKPLLPTDCKELSFIEVGCNAGLFLKLAKEHGFSTVLGVEPNKGAYERALNYPIVNKRIEDYIDEMPVADVVLFSNIHYYVLTKDWPEIVNKLKDKASYCIVVTTKKKPNLKYAPSDVAGIIDSFKGWKEVETIYHLPDSTPHSRHLWSLLFENPLIKRLPINSLDNGNTQQRGFLEQIDNKVDVFKTDYYRRLVDYRKRTGSNQTVWTKDELDKYMYDRIDLYEDMKENGLKDALIVGKANRLKDGNHRHEILKHLGYRTTLCRVQ